MKSPPAPIFPHLCGLVHSAHKLLSTYDALLLYSRLVISHISEVSVSKIEFTTILNNLFLSSSGIGEQDPAIYKQ